MPRNQTTWVAKPIAERFAAKYSVSPTGCWLWTGTMQPRGTRRGEPYGVFKFADGTGKPAHRVSYELHIGKIPAGALVLHSCDVRHCVNPAHLRIGTHQDNMDDLRNRFRGVLGEKNVNSKLTPERVRELRSRYAAGEPVEEIAASMGVTPACACMAICRFTWRHIP